MKRRFAIGVGLVLLALLAFVVGRATGGAAEEQAAEAGAESYTCAMHVHVESSEPGECPICGMDLVPRSSVGPGSSDPTRVMLSDRAAALARVRTVTVREEGGGGELRLLGRAEVDESSESVVTAWIAGRIDRLHANETGQRLRRGQRVATLYSPEVYAAHHELLVARRQLERLSGASELAQSGARATLDAARTRLALLGIPDRELDAMALEDAPRRHVSIRSPFAGTVLSRVATEGAYVTVGAPLYRLARLDTLWAQLEVFESDLGRVAVGQPVELRAAARPDLRLEGRVAFVDPRVDRVTRSARVRVEIEDAGELRPGAELEGLITLPAAPSLSIPSTAPLFTGQRSLVYVEVTGESQPTYEARVVRLGPRAGDRYPVLAGLEPGERVVRAGAFALDADLQIQGGASMMTRRSDPARALTEPQRAALAAMMTAGLDVAEQLAADALPEARAAAERVAASARGLAPAPLGWASLAEPIAAAAAAVAASEDLEAARLQFEALGLALEPVIDRYGNPTDAPLRRAHCPMAFDNRGATWLQRGDAIDNPYFGERMRTCGSIRALATPGDSFVAGSAQ